LPEKEGALGLWAATPTGMLCEACWKKATDMADISRIKTETRVRQGEEFCCFCVLCGRVPPDPWVWVWVETERGCLCGACLKKVIPAGVEIEIQKLLQE
jgi:hypothetical protein